MDDRRTEAACLLETGALYRERVGLVPSGGRGDPVFAGVKHGAFSLYFGDAPIYHFDLEGRWQRAYLDGLHYLKGLDAEVHELARVREGANLVLRRRQLSVGEAADLDARIRLVSLDIVAGLAEGRFRRQEPPVARALPLGNDELHELLERIARWDATAWIAHRGRYTGTYGPLPFLPPECQNAVVLQATLGHSGGRTFGLATPHEPYFRSHDEFARHIREVVALWGRRLLQSRIIFLSGDHLLQQPLKDIEKYLDAIRQAFPVRSPVEARGVRFVGIHALSDDFSGRGLGAGGWSRIAERGLTRVSLGVESGAPVVRSAYGKDWEDDELRSTVSDLKTAGLGVSVLALVGAGGIERSDEHVEATARLIGSLELGQGDFVFLLDENEIHSPGLSPPGATHLNRIDWLDQQRRMREAMASLKKRGVKVLPYTIEKQWT